jgi:hypothetical protein
MRIVTIAVMGGVVALAAAFAPAMAGAVKVRFDHGHNVLRIESGWRASLATPSCWTKKSLKRDYNGNLYLKKVRVCA